MKILSIIALLISAGGLSAGIYNQMEFVPLCESDFDFGDLFYYYHEQKMMWGTIALFAGALGTILGVVGGIKKQKIGWIAAAAGLVSLILGLMQSTHMFS